MKIGLLRVDLRLPACSSLKSKRSILKRLINSLRRQYNVGVAELDNHDQPFACKLGIVTIYRNGENVDKALRNVLSLLDKTPDIQVADYLIEMM